MSMLPCLLCNQRQSESGYVQLSQLTNTTNQKKNKDIGYQQDK